MAFPGAPTTTAVNDGGWPLAMEGYEQVGELGAGAFAKVLRVHCPSKGAHVALKVVQKEAFRKGINLGALKELQALQELQHPNVIGLLAAFVHNEKVHLALTLCKCDLTALIRDRSIALTEAHAKCVLLQLLDALAYMHSRGIMHRDIKPDNLLLKADGTVQLSDFGHAARALEPGAPAYHRVVTLWYRAPELLFQSPTHGPPVDLWAAGCVLGELLLRQPLFPGFETDESQLAHIFRLLGTPVDPEAGGAGAAADVNGAGWYGRGVTVGYSVAADCQREEANAAEAGPAQPRGGGSGNSWPGCSRLPGFCEFELCKVQPWRSIFAAVGGVAGAPALSDGALDLLAGLLVYDPARRLTAAAARAHSWFTTEPLPCSPGELPLPAA